jgi:hypothetical protein
MKELITKGTKVSWSSQANGTTIQKVGVVIAVVDPREGLTGAMNRAEGPGWSLRYGLPSAPGTWRKHESYLIQVGKRKRLYWPRVKALRVVE